ncbi:hypothetical protein WMF01_06185 [Sorangium sp. So ce1667]
MVEQALRAGKKAVEGSEGELNLERYAEIVAHVLYFGDVHCPELLRRLDVNPAVWRRTVRSYSESISAEARQGRTDLAERFIAALTPVRARLAVEQPPLSAIGNQAFDANVKPGASLVPMSITGRIDCDVSLETSPALPPESSPLPARPTYLTGARGSSDPSTSGADFDQPLPNPGSRDSSSYWMLHHGSPASLTLPPSAPLWPTPPDLMTGQLSAPSQCTGPDVTSTAILTAAERPLSTAAPLWVALEKHAALCAELVIDPACTALILSRCGLSLEEKQRIDAQWWSLFASNPALWEAWYKVYSEQVEKRRKCR